MSIHNLSISLSTRNNMNNSPNQNNHLGRPPPLNPAAAAGGVGVGGVGGIAARPPTTNNNYLPSQSQQPQQQQQMQQQQQFNLNELYQSNPALVQHYFAARGIPFPPPAASGGGIGGAIGLARPNNLQQQQQQQQFQGSSSSNMGFQQHQQQQQHQLQQHPLMINNRPPPNQQQQQQILQSHMASGTGVGNINNSNNNRTPSPVIMNNFPLQYQAQQQQQQQQQFLMGNSLRSTTPPIRPLNNGIGMSTTSPGLDLAAQKQQQQQQRQLQQQYLFNQMLAQNQMRPPAVGGTGGQRPGISSFPMTLVQQQMQAAQRQKLSQMPRPTAPLRGGPSMNPMMSNHSQSPHSHAHPLPPQRSTTPKPNTQFKDQLSMETLEHLRIMRIRFGETIAKQQNQLTNSIQSPDLSVFKSKEDMIQRLLPYHLTQFPEYHEIYKDASRLEKGRTEREAVLKNRIAAVEVQLEEAKNQFQQDRADYYKAYCEELLSMKDN